ncbi:MAG: GTPase Era [Alicyclobacillus herbarius]|uniref:GTPase Era n=1 Tax=Alicyclobacillus herbarius TaxID=122960 RepID=UPI002354C32B|nr:GTPase Era [Alicyclobacillus herbarius]MCL6631091.1 GTPase Era [Alicyclobacillus herbarius]
MNEEKRSFRSGFAALIGRPNVGKSTLLNALVGQKVAIMSNRPQTTRNRIRGILTTDHAQAVFIDTPGIHKPRHRLGEYMVEAAVATLREVDLILLVCDATTPNHPGDEHVIDLLKGVHTPVFLVINKVDAVAKPAVLEMMAEYKDRFGFAEIVPISAREGTQVDTLRELITERLPEGPKYYPDEMVTDNPERFIMAELIREKVLRLTREEVPHSVMVDVEHLERRENGVLYSYAVIYCERDSQKGILIGKHGQMLREVGALARREMESLFGTRVFLELRVKVRKDWRNEPSLLHRWGFDQQ